VLRDDQRQVLEVLRDLPHRQRDCLVLRYYQELGIDDIADTLGISRNSVKTHLQRGLAAMETRLGDMRADTV
jgi:RNA polymerase sigma factor (sigma-70 family)